jgi:hypothetical protein
VASQTVSLPDIVEFVTHQDFLGLSISPAQESLLRTIYGLPFETAEQEDLFHLCTGRQQPYTPGSPFEEITVVSGRRGGKDSRIACPIAIFEAIFGGYEDHLSKGERGIIPIVAQDARGTDVAFTYIREYIVGNPLLREILAEEYKFELRLKNRMSVVAFACTAKSLRGWSVPCAIMDEVAFFRTESGAIVDLEIQKALIPAGVNFKQQRLIKISTPHVKAGVIWTDFEKYYGKDDPDVLVWQASTSLMNPTVSEKKLTRERRVDPVRYAQEYEALFNDVVTGAIPGAWIDAAVVERRTMLRPQTEFFYTAAVDPSGGANDEFALTVVHVEGTTFVQDLLRAWPGSRQGKVDLAAICAEIAQLIRPYGLNRIVGDHYAGQWVDQEFRKVNVFYEPYEGTKSQAYKELIPVFAQNRIHLLDDSVQTLQFRLLEQTQRIGGKPPVIDHPRGGHDDRSNALAYAVAYRAKSLSPAIDIGADPILFPTTPLPDETPTIPSSVEGLERVWGRRVVAPANFWGRNGISHDRPRRGLWGLL